MPESDAILERLLSLHPKRIDLTLDRVWTLLEELGNPQNNLPPVVHIAGTNGKGSTLAFLKAIAEAAGLRVHRYSSPHLVRFHERITLCGKNIAEDALSALLEECETRQGKRPITFFEITTAAAMLAFARTPADLLLLETGLGGRLDATNVLPKTTVSVLSRIGIDHQEFLGTTLQAIATEKVAIARRDVPLVVAPQLDEAMQVIHDYAVRHNVMLCAAGQHWQYQQTSEGWRWQDKTQQLDLPHPALRGAHQYQNAALAVSVAKTLQKQNFPIEDAAIAQGVACAQWPGRMQQIKTGRLTAELPNNVQVWVDGGHNLDAGAIMADMLRELPEPRLIVGMLKNKDCAGYLQLLVPYLEGAQSLTIPNTQAALSAEAIAALHPALRPARDFSDALEYACARGGKNLIICGSLYLIGAFLSQN